MAIIVGSARVDERGKYSGGAAGDQTGREVATQNFYVHKQGWYVLRAKSDAHANAIASKMLQACNNNNIGYDQGNRLGVINYGIGTSVKTECDCSSLVRQCVKEATGVDAGNFTTANEVSKLVATGLFTNVGKYNSGTALYNGDVLVTCTQGHTVVICSGANARGGSAANNTNSGTANVFYCVKAGGTCYSEVKNTTDYAGVENKKVTDLAVRVDNGTVQYRVHILGGSWLPWVSGYNWNDGNNGYAGNGKAIDGIQIKSSHGGIKYRVSNIGTVNYLPWVTEASDYAGIFGKAIDKIQITF